MILINIYLIQIKIFYQYNLHLIYTRIPPGNLTNTYQYCNIFSLPPAKKPTHQIVIPYPLFTLSYKIFIHISNQDYPPIEVQDLKTDQIVPPRSKKFIEKNPTLKACTFWEMNYFTIFVTSWEKKRDDNFEDVWSGPVD